MDNQWIVLSGRGQVINMAQMVEAEPLEDGKLCLRMVAGMTLMFEGQEARQIMAWLKENGQLVQA